MRSGRRSSDVAIYGHDFTVRAGSMDATNGRKLANLIYLQFGPAYDWPLGSALSLTLMAFISINLGLINLLPIPMLDGGHLLVFGVEGVRRKPLSQKARVRIQQAGLVLIVLITILASRNDVMHLFR